MKILRIIFILACAVFLAAGRTSGNERDHRHDDGEHQEEGHHHDEHDHDHGGHGEGEDHHDEEGVTLSAEAQRSAGLKTVTAEPAAFAEKISVTGRIAQDVENIHYVISPASGVLKKCPHSLGAAVKKDDVLCRIQPLDAGEAVELKSPAHGVIIADFVNAGERVDTVSPIHTVADYSKLAASFDIYEQDIRHVKPGQKVNVSAPAYPGHMFAGEVVFISPRVDESTFTVKIRVNIDNQDLLLKPGMSVRGDIL